MSTPECVESLRCAIPDGGPTQVNPLNKSSSSGANFKDARPTL